MHALANYFSDLGGAAEEKSLGPHAPSYFSLSLFSIIKKHTFLIAVYIHTFIEFMSKSDTCIKIKKSVASNNNLTLHLVFFTITEHQIQWQVSFS